MGKKAPQAPAPPDPVATAAAQTQGDVQSAIANAYIGNANQYGPLGSSVFNQIGNVQIKDAQGKPIDVPRFSQTTTLSPEQQGLYNQQTAIGGKMNTIADQQLDRLGSTLSQPISSSSLPPLSQIGQGQGIKHSYDPGGAIQKDVRLNANAPTTFGQTSARIQNDVGPNDFSEDRLRVENALMSRLNPQIERDRASAEQRFANQGIGLGSQAYATGVDELSRGATDARLQAILAGGQEQSRMFGMELDRGQFHNAAQGQDFGQQQARGLFGLQGIGMNNDATMNMGNFHNAAQSQQNQQNLQAGQFHDAAQNQWFGQAQNRAEFDAVQRQRALQEQLAIRNQPINEIGALTSGGQVTMPQFQGFNAPSVPGSTIGQNTYQSANLAQQQWAQQANMAGQSNAGLFGLGASGLGALGQIMAPAAMFSDRRLKTDIEQIGEAKGLPLYSFRYLGDDDTSIGFMADEVEQVYPAAVIDIGGVKAVDYGMVLAYA